MASVSQVAGELYPVTQETAFERVYTKTVRYCKPMHVSMEENPPNVEVYVDTFNLNLERKRHGQDASFDVHMGYAPEINTVFYCYTWDMHCVVYP